MTHLTQRAAEAEVAFKAEQNSTEMRMLQIVTFVANDPQIQQLFLQGKRAVETKGSDSALAAAIRLELYNHVGSGRDVLAKHFNFRQLQFHLAHNTLSFLRVHQPEKFGDPLESLRYTIVATNSELKPVTGFETGRISSGIRGVTPVFAEDGIAHKNIYIGALEAGTSFTTTLSLFHKNRPLLDAAVLISREHLQDKLWSEFKEKQFIHNFNIEATTSQQIELFLQQDYIDEILTKPGHHLIDTGKTQYSFTSFALRDFHGTTNPNLPDAGVIVLWRDVSAMIATYHQDIRSLILYGILLFVIIELLMFYGLRLVTQSLQHELTHIQQLVTIRAKAVQAAKNMDDSILHPHLYLQRIIQGQVDNAVQAIDAEFGMFIHTTSTDEYRVLAVSDMLWSTVAGIDLYDKARQKMVQQGYFAIQMTDNRLIRALQHNRPIILNNTDCQGFIGLYCPPGHPPINNLLLIPVMAGKHHLGLLALANRQDGFGDDEQTIAKAYASAAALIIHTDQREVARLSAEESSRLQATFLANMNHELRTPMNTIMGLGELLSNSTLNEQQQDFIDNINRSSKFLLNLINEILIVSKLQNQTIEKPLAANFDLNDLISRIVKKFSVATKDNEVTLKVDIADYLPAKLNGYPTQLEQILLQLVGNAIKFGHNGEVTLAVKLQQQDNDTLTLMFCITDSGIGIAAHHLEVIFEPFFQCDNSNTREYNGSGLGLAIAQKVCSQLGGNIVVQSSQDKGSQFSFQLKFKIIAQQGDNSATSENSSEAPLATTVSTGTIAEMDLLLQQLEDPLTKLQPKKCKDIANKLSRQQWPDHVHEEINKLIRFIGKYRFTEALNIVAKLRRMI